MMDNTIVNVNGKDYSCQSRIDYVNGADHVAYLTVIQVDQVQVVQDNAYQKKKTVFVKPSDTLAESSPKYRQIRNALVSKLTKKYNVKKLFI